VDRDCLSAPVGDVRRQPQHRMVAAADAQGAIAGRSAAGPRPGAPGLPWCPPASPRSRIARQAWRQREPRRFAARSGGAHAAAHPGRPGGARSRSTGETSPWPRCARPALSSGFTSRRTPPSPPVRSSAFATPIRCSKPWRPARPGWKNPRPQPGAPDARRPGAFPGWRSGAGPRSRASREATPIVEPANRRESAPPTGIEPVACSLGNYRSIQLSYGSVPCRY
jgi:hypothetical protein